MKRWQRTTLLLSFALLIGFFAVQHAWALNFTDPFSGDVVQCDTGTTESVTVKVVSCIKAISFAYSKAFLQKMTEIMLPASYAIMTIAVVLTAMRVALLERNPQKIIYALLFKMIFVLILVNNFGGDGGGVSNVWGEDGLLGALYGMMEGMQEWIIEAMYVSTDSCDLNTSAGKTSDYITATGYKPFAYMDCILQYILGFNTAAGIGASLLGFVSSAMFGGTMGSMVFFFGLAVLLAITFFVIRVIYTVIICYVFLGLLIGVAPLFVWTLLFKQTEQTFFTYMFNILSSILQPFMMVAFMGFAIPLLNTYILDETNQRSLVNVLGEATPTGTGDGKAIVDHYRGESPFCNLTIPTDLQFYNRGLNREKVDENTQNPIETGSVNWCSKLQGASVDLGPEHNNKMLEIARSLLYIVVIAMIISSVGAQIPMLTAYIVTRGRALANSIGEGLPFEQQLQGSMASARSGGVGGMNSLQSLFKK